MDVGGNMSITEEQYKSAMDIINEWNRQKEAELRPKLLWDLNISLRAHNVLKNEFGLYFPIKRYKDVKKSHLLTIKGCGDKLVKEIEDALMEHDIKLL